jgi:hypothetical protein
MLICGVIGGGGYALQQAAFMAMGLAVPGAFGDNPAETAGVIVGMLIGGFCGVAVLALVMSFITAAVYHGMLSLLGGANEGFEATYRVVAYTSSHSFLLYLIPCCGSHIGGLASLILAIIGLSYAHDTSGWRASGAVLIPTGVCCLGLVGFFVALLNFNPN